MTTFANVYVGNSANDGTGTDLRDAFEIINNNFANIAAGNANITVNAPVLSVAGRTGNINLTVNDVAGAASIGYITTLFTEGLLYNNSNVSAYLQTYDGAILSNVLTTSNVISPTVGNTSTFSLYSGTSNWTFSPAGGITLPAGGSITYPDGTVQHTSTASSVNNLDHIIGAYVVSSGTRTLTLASDATPNNTPSTIVSRDSSGNISVGNITASTLNTTSVLGNSSIAGSMIIYGNLQVRGTTTTITSETQNVSTLAFHIANTAVTSSQADGAAFIVGDGTSYADWTFDNAQTAWRSNISLVPAVSLEANIGSTSRSWNNIFSSNVTASNKLNVGPTPPQPFDTIAQFTASEDSSGQVNVQNTYNTSNASSDLVATADNGNNNINYIDVGINGSGYSQTAYSISYANDGYMYVNGGNLTIGTQTPGKAVVFHTGNTLAANEAGRIEGSGQRWLLNATDDGVNKLQVEGNIRTSGGVTVGSFLQIPNFPNDAARDAAIPNAQAGMFSMVNYQLQVYTTSWNVITL